MPESHETKARIKAIRSRVLQDSSKEKINQNDGNIISVQNFDIKRSQDTPIQEVQTNFIKKEDFKLFENQLNNDIKNYFSALDEKLNKALCNFEIKIPDIKKGSSARNQLDDEIGDIISKQMIQQSHTLNRAIEGLSDRYATTNDLGEVKRGLEEVFERETNLKLEKILVENKKSLQAGLIENSSKLEEFNNSIREDLSTFAENFTHSKDQTEIKLCQNDEKITLLSSDVQDRIAKANLNLLIKNSSLEDSLFQKLGIHFEESTSKLDQLEGLVTESAVNSSKASEALKHELEIRLEDSSDKLKGFNCSIRKDFSSFCQKVEYNSDENIKKFTELEGSVTDSITSSALELDVIKKDLEIGLVDGLGKLDEFNSFIRKDHSSFVGGFNSSIDEINAKLKQNDESTVLLGSDIRNRIAKISLDTLSKNNSLEESLLQKFEYDFNKNNDKFKEIEGILSDSIVSSFKASDAVKKDLETGLKDSLDQLEGFSNSIREDFNSLLGSFESSNEEFDAKIKQNDEKITASNSDLQAKISKVNFDFSIKNSALEKSLFQKLEYNIDKSDSKFIGLEGMVADSIRSSAKASDAIKKDFEIELVDSLDKLEGMNSSIREDFDAFTGSFNSANNYIDTKLKQNDEKIILLGSDMRNGIAKLTLELTKKNSVSEEIAFQKFENFYNKFNILETEIEKNMTEFRSAGEKNLDLFDGLKRDVECLRVSASESGDALSFELKILIKEFQEKITQKIEMSQVESFFNHEINEKLKAFSSGFSDRFQAIDRSIQLVESMIVGEDDLTALFQNYTLNLNVMRDKNVEKLV